MDTLLMVNVSPLRGYMNVRHNVAEQRFEIEQEGETALLDYRERDGKLRLTHTEVPESMSGGGVGSALVKSALEHARERGMKVVPLCSFAIAWMKRHPEYNDLLETN